MADKNFTTAESYLMSAGPSAEAARSEFHMSAAHFQFPSDCFSQTSTYLPRSLTGLPLASFMVSSYVPLTKPISPDFATSTFVAFQLMARPDLASKFCQTFRIPSFVVAADALGGIPIDV